MDVTAIRNLPLEFPSEGQALLIERFDRPRSGQRIHQEDFAQVFEIGPEDKDRLVVAPDLVSVTYAGIGAVVAALAGPADFAEFVRRLAFTVLAGNADAHARNWSLVYPDRVRARLSPLYDVVSTVAYPSLHRTLSLGLLPPDDPMLATPLALADVTYGHIRELAEHAGESADATEWDVREFVARARATWEDVRSVAPPFVAEGIELHLAQVSL